MEGTEPELSCGAGVLVLADRCRSERLAAVRQLARASPEWACARRTLSDLCLFTGHLRPAGHEAAVYGFQGTVPVPGADPTH